MSHNVSSPKETIASKIPVLKNGFRISVFMWHFILEKRPYELNIIITWHNVENQ